MSHEDSEDWSADEITAAEQEEAYRVDDTVELFPGPVRKLAWHTLANTILGVVGFGIHLWTTWLAYQAEGFWKSVLYFTLMIYAELYWAYLVFQEQGPNLFSAIAGSWAVLYIISLVTLGVQSKRLKQTLPEWHEDEEE